MFEDIVKNFNEAIKDLEQVKRDAEELAKKEENKKNGKGDENGVIKGDEKVVEKKRTFIEPVTRLRGNVEEINKAKENPEQQKIEDRLNQILEGLFK